MMRAVLVAACAAAAAAAASGASLQANPAVLARSGDEVKLQWSGVSGAGEQDVIEVKAVPGGASSGLGEVVFGYVNVSSAASWATGAGVLSVPLSNIREYSYVFTYTHTVGGAAVAASSPVRFAQPNEPTQVHLALAGAGEMRVMWTTADAASPAVQWGSSATSLTNSARGSSSSYNSSNLCGSPATDSDKWMAPGQVHDAVMTGLQAAETVFYRVGDSASGVWSDVFSFTAAPAAAAEVQLLLYGDMGTMLPFETDEEQQPPSVQTTNSCPPRTSVFSSSSRETGSSSAIRIRMPDAPRQSWGWPVSVSSASPSRTRMAAGTRTQ